MSASYLQTITDADIKQFAGISGDRNPVHLDEEYASQSRYGKRIAHGMNSASFFPHFLALNYRVSDVYMFHNLLSSDASLYQRYSNSDGNY
ncbi:MaoC/PaaZ C-terminal domain-containing protein [Vibrio parahaemolyticus]